MVGKVLRVVSEAASRAAYGFQGKCLSHTLSTQKILLELEKQRLLVQAAHCIEAEAFLKRSVFYKLNSVTRVQKAQMLESSGCLYGILEKPEQAVLVTSEQTTWLEDQSLEFGLGLLKWNFPGRPKQRWSFVSPTLSLRWQMAEEPEYKAMCSRVLSA